MSTPVHMVSQCASKSNQLMSTPVHMASLCASKSYQKASVVEEHHSYKVIWIPEVSEEVLGFL